MSSSGATSSGLRFAIGCKEATVRTSNTVLVIDDDPQILSILDGILRNEGEIPILERDPRKAIRSLVDRPVDVLFTDLRMSDCDGFEVIREARRAQPGLPIVVITGYGSLDSSINAFRLGVVDYLIKPFRAEQVANALARASATAHSQRTARGDVRPPSPRSTAASAQLDTASPAMKQIISIAIRMASSHAPICVRGEIGAGKETVIRLIHAHSQQRHGPFIKVNCEAMSESKLIEHFFGVDTADDGATQPGVIEQAEGGILFLHHAATLPHWLQAMLLRTVREGGFPRKGGTVMVRCRARMALSITTTPGAKLDGGDLLDDFHSYAEAAPIQVPPLRERRDEIRPLIRSILKKDECAELNRKWPRGIEFSSAALNLLEEYSWPGNLYELYNVVRRSIIFATAPLISEEQVAESLQPHAAACREDMISVPLVGGLKSIERAIVSEVINRLRGNKAAAARSLGLHRKSLYRIMGR
jgi:DNA-binding NtrC family response regulator